MARSRDEFAAYAEARRGQLRRFAFSLCGDWHQAEDVVQIALTKLYVAWPRVHRSGTEDAYTRRIVARVAIDESRRPWRREVLAEIEAEVPLPPAAADVGYDVVGALQRLPPCSDRSW